MYRNYIQVIIAITFMYYSVIQVIAKTVFDDNSGIVWGESTNGVRAGLFGVQNELKYSLSLGAKVNSHSLHQVLGSITVTNIVCRTPRSDKLFLFEMINDDGISVQQTTNLMTIVANIQDFKQNYQRKKLFSITLHPNNSYIFGDEIDLSKYFVLTNVGSYKLKASSWIVMTQTSNRWHCVELPYVIIPVSVIK